jgi:hypothetical protein
LLVSAAGDRDWTNVGDAMSARAMSRSKFVSFIPACGLHVRILVKGGTKAKAKERTYTGRTLEGDRDT